MFNKWELVEENKAMIELTYAFLIGMTYRNVHVDVYRKKKFNGVYKYKNIVREDYK